MFPAHRSFGCRYAVLGSLAAADTAIVELMAWVESTEDWRQVPRSLLKSLVVIVVAGVAFGYAIGLLLARGFDTLHVEKLGNQPPGQEAEVPDAAGILRP